MQRLQQESQVRVERHASKYLLKGTFSQVESCYSFLKKYFSDKDSFLKMISGHSKDSALTKNTFKGVAKGGTLAKTEGSFSENDERAWQETSLKKTQSTTRKDHSYGNPTIPDAPEPGNDTGKLLVQTYETTPIIIRFINQVYKDRLNVISEEFSVKLAGSHGDTKLTVEPNVNCNENKYNDACNDFIELYKSTIQGVTKCFLSLKPDNTIPKEQIGTAVRKAEKSFPVLIEQGQESNDWVIFGDRNSVEAAKEHVHKQLGLSSDTGKGRRKRAPATGDSKTDSIGETANVKISASQPKGSREDIKNLVEHISTAGKSETTNAINTASWPQGDPSGGDLQNSMEHVSKNGFKISVFQGDITEQPVDAIVNAANTALDLMRGGLGGEILRKGGSSVQTDANSIIRQRGSVKVGNAVWTKAGRLPCKVVIQAVGPQDWPGQNEKRSRQFLHSAYLNSLECAKMLKLKSVAVPAIGTGVIGVPLEVCATQLFNAIEQFRSKKGDVTDIRIVNLTDEAHEVFKKEFLKRYTSGQSGTSPSKSKNIKGDSEAGKDETTTASNAKPDTTRTPQLPGDLQSGKNKDIFSLCNVYFNSAQYCGSDSQRAVLATVI